MMDISRFKGSMIWVSSLNCEANVKGILREIGPQTITLELTSGAEIQVRRSDIVKVGDKAGDVPLPAGFRFIG